jgi:hypothetical protein
MALIASLRNSLKAAAEGIATRIRQKLEDR